MVALSQANAQKAGVTGKATFRQADLFETDFSKANVVTLFLLPDINRRLRPKILDMRPGTRIVSNTFRMEDPETGNWEPDASETIPNCSSWCTALLWIVPAKVQGAWQIPQGTLTLKQTFQNIEGTLGPTPITNGKMNGAQITFRAGANQFAGTVNGNTIDGVLTGTGGTKTPVRATRSR
jgi:hypothetical protein